MGSPRFAWVWKEIGVKDDPWRPELTIPVRMGGETMIMLRDAKGVPTPPDTSMLARRGDQAKGHPGSDLELSR